MGFAIKGFDDVQAAGDDELAYNCREDDEPATVETVKAEPPTTADNRIAEAEKFFNLLFGNVTAKHFSYLITFNKYGAETFDFVIADETQQRSMARKAIELADNGKQVWHAVNPVSVKPHYEFDEEKQKKVFKRGGEDVVSYQTAIVVDVDIRSGAHKSGNLAVDFDEAKSFLPFTPSLILNSGYGLQAYYIFDEPIKITADNREEIKHRNKLLLDVIRARANGKDIDGVGDLPRIFRTPGTRNYKLGVSNDAPLCHVVEVNDIRFTPADIDEKLAALKPANENLFDEKKSARADVQKKSLNDTPSTLDDDDDYKKFRIRKMLDCISVVDGEYEKWLNVGMGLFNEGMSCSDWEQWSRTQPEFKEGECESKWRSFHNDSGGITIATLHEYAKAGGYDEKSTKREWYQLHPELSTRPQKHKDTQAEPVQDVKKNSVDTSATTGDAELDELLAVYRNTYDAPIDPKIISELKTAKEFVDNLTPENISAADVASLKNRRLIALLKVYAPNLAEKFYGVLRGQKVIPLTEFNKAVSKLLTGIERAQKNYQEAEQKRFDKQRELACKNNNSGKRTRDTISDCPVNFIVPADFVFDGRGINAIRFSRGEPCFDSVTRTPIVVTRKFREPTKGTLIYEFAILSDEKWRTVEVDGATLADPRELAKILCRSGALIDSKDLLISFFNDFIALNADVARVNVYNRTGWASDDCTEFIFPNNGDYAIRRPSFDFGKIFATRGKADVWKDMYRKLLKTGGAISAMAIGTSLAAPLARMFNIPNIQTHLHGKSGAAKTALQKFSASIYGDPTQLLRTFAATSKNRQTVADAFNDLPTFFDELETGRDKSAELNLCSDVYRYSSGKLGEANKRNGDARDASEFKGARLTTGERQILKGNALQGAFKRLVQIETRRGIFDDFAADIHIVAENNFGHFGRQWLNFIIAHADEIKSRYVTLATTIIKASKRHEETQIKSVVATIIAVEFFDMMIENRAEFSERDTFELAAGIVETLPTFNDIDDCARALNDLRSFFDGHEKYFLHGIREERDNSTHAIETYGQKFDDNSVAFFPTALVKILEQDLGYASADKLIREFASKGLLRRGEADRYTCKSTIGNKRCSVYLFNKGVIVEADYSEDEYYDRMADEYAD